jgi:hypothetical protein
LSGTVWTIDSWDGEKLNVEMKDVSGNVIASKEFQAWHSQQATGQQRTQCEGSVGGWQDGYFDFEMEADYDPSMGDVTAKVTTTLDQGAGDESFGIGNMRLHFEFDDGRPVSEGDYDEGETNPTALW